MTFLIGLLCGVALFGALLLAYSAGQRVNHSKPTATDEEKRKAKEMQEHFQSLMNYDVSQALQRKKVT